MGQLGNGSNQFFATSPVAVAGLSGVKAISLGDGHSCALLAGGTVKCWGWNLFGQLGNGSNQFFANSPVAVSGLVGVTAISAGGYHGCALLNAGTVRCWGYNDSGQLGDGTLTNRSTPVAVPNLAGVVALSLGGSEHTCALVNGGAVKCWGRNMGGELGAGARTLYESSPVAVTGLTGVTGIDAGGRHTCVLLAGGSLKCWGDNEYGELGNRTLIDSPSPVEVWS
jgi:alpha-tubulin suppressor-like RCC1 family protein